MIGRNRELEYLDILLKAKQPQFLAVTGRRRIGKTYLVRNFFQHRIKYMEVVGKKDAKKEESLELFIDALNLCFSPSVKFPLVATWKLALRVFTDALREFNQPLVLFLDELPWLAGKDPELLSEIDHFWNTEWSKISNFKFIVCGSATSWILENIINNKGGLHNRLTAMLHLKPLILKEVEEYLLARGVNLSRDQIISLYICIGGVPYYLDWVQAGKSVPEIIQDLCFSENGRLTTEYDALLDSLFNRSKNYKLLLKALSTKRYGLTAKELEEETAISRGGNLNTLLKELESCHFIKKYFPYGSKRKNSYYRLVDEFVMFHYKWIEPFKERGISLEKDYWLKCFNSQEFASWAGYNFETVCHKHVDAILAALGISGIRMEISHWNQKIDESIGFGKSRYQIDLVIDRADKVVNLCEVKFSSAPLILDKKLISEIKEKESVFRHITKCKKQVVSVLISASDVLASSSVNFVGRIIQGEYLFKD